MPSTFEANVPKLQIFIHRDDWDHTWSNLVSIKVSQNPKGSSKEGILSWNLLKTVLEYDLENEEKILDKCILARHIFWNEHQSSFVIKSLFDTLSGQFVALDRHLHYMQ